MQPPISIGTVLQNRYRILSILGQGGFGRTYLAEDQGRFNELCALKEFIPNQTSDFALEKSRELFQREASILYQIQHPQVPQFRATFQEDQRLFLVQDYVEGKTYRDLLNDRQIHGKAFTESEVLKLLQQLIPVLAHLHSKGIIHRDITPDNIILRERDQVPVLIDFGVVKEIAARTQMNLTTPQPVTTARQSTTVGKMGYAPSEQMQTGRAYPSSDFYALAVTAVVLLTGKEPPDLYDDSMLTWHWQQWTTVRPEFAQVLNRMLSYRPGDRFQTASEVAQALQRLTSPTAMPPPTVQAQPRPDISRMQTIAVGRAPVPAPQTHYAAPTHSPRGQDPVVPRPQQADSVWDNPWAVFAIGTGLAIVTVVTALAVVRAIYDVPPETPVVTPTPTPTEPAEDEDEPEPTEADRPVEYRQRLSLASGSSTTMEGSLQANETINYIISAEEGEALRALVEGEGVLLSVFGPNGDLVDNRAERVSFWEGTLTASGDYVVQVRPVRGLPQSDYRLNIGLESAAEEEPEPEPEPTPTPPPTPAEPEIETRRLSIPAGETNVRVSGQASEQLIKRYLVNAQANQVLSAELVEGPVTLTIRYPNGQVVEDARGVVFWQAQLPESGDYQIDVIATQQSNFRLEVSITGLE
jgi:serine/threonine protein kinase